MPTPHITERHIEAALRQIDSTNPGESTSEEVAGHAWAQAVGTDGDAIDFLITVLAGGLADAAEVPDANELSDDELAPWEGLAQAAFALGVLAARAADNENGEA